MGLNMQHTGVTEADSADLRAIVGDSNVRIGDAVRELDPGWNQHNLEAGIVVSPGSTAEVADVVRCCARHSIEIVAQGGRTGLVGGSESHAGQIVLSLLRLNEIEPITPNDRVAVVGAGCTLEALQTAAAEHGLEPGIDLAARGSATIGGMISTNAGGVMAFRNGVMRHRVFGLEAVLADGSIYSDLTRVVKNSAGYDVKQLFIGGEGTLGVVTKAVIKLDPMPEVTATAMIALPSVDAALATIRRALATEAGHLRAAEAMWSDYITLTAGALGWSEPSIDLGQPIFLLLLLGGPSDDALHAALGGIFTDIAGIYPGVDGIVAGSARQTADLWRLREESEIVYRLHPNAPSYDVSVPQSQIADYVAAVRAGLAAIDPAYRPYLFGHLADGNLHILLNSTGPLPDSLAQQVDDVLYATLRSVGGSFSAEHGVGSKRIGAMFATTDPGKLAAMQLVKATLDPANLMNPGKVLPRHHGEHAVTVTGR
jgi:FAD/FMN-containing dehydrogenase